MNLGNEILVLQQQTMHFIIGFKWFKKVSNKFASRETEQTQKQTVGVESPQAHQGDCLNAPSSFPQALGQQSAAPHSQLITWIYLLRFHTLEMCFSSMFF